MSEPGRIVAQVIVDRAVWGLDRELTYRVPPELASRLRVGSIVRVPLNNRRVRGWVVDLGTAPPGASLDNLLPIAAVSGRGPVFDPDLLAMARALARRYVQPLSSFLRLFTPPRLGARTDLWPAIEPFAPGGSPRRTLMRLAPGEDPTERYAARVQAALARGLGAIVAVPEVREGSMVLDRLAEQFPAEAAVVHSGLDPAGRSRALWSIAEGRRKLVLGGRGALFAPSMSLGTIVLHQEHDPSYKHQQAPYYDAREAAVFRAQVTGAEVVLASSTPSLGAAHRFGKAWRVEGPDPGQPRSAWPEVEVVAPARRGLAQRAIAGLLEAHRNHRTAMILLPRVHATESGFGPEQMAALVARILPGARVTRADRPGLGEPGGLREALAGEVIVATEAALAEVGGPSLGLAIALGVDGYFRKPRGRAAEDAMSSLWALGSLAAGQNPAGRLILESRFPEHHALQALVRGDYAHFARKELEARKAAAAPPFMHLIRLQTAPRPSPEFMEQLRRLPGATVLGPVEGGLGAEILLKVHDLERIVDPLGTIVRLTSRRVLVEVDPKDW